MGSRPLPFSLALGALLADAAGVHRLGFWLLLLAVPCAAAAAFVAVADVLDGRNARLRAGATTLALALLLLGSAVRDNAPQGRGVPALAISAVLGAVLLYGLPALAWVLEPFVPRPRFRTPPARIRTQP
jgi:hypothetical protein